MEYLVTVYYQIEVEEKDIESAIKEAKYQLE